MRPRKPIAIKSEWAEIPLKKGIVALIDLSDVPTADKYGWVLDDTKANWYVHTCIDRKLRTKTVRLHQLLLQPPKGFFVDHKNGNGLDNRRSNLRLATNSQNGANRRKLSPKTSAYKGVHRRENGKWRASIRVNKRLLHLGTFENEIDAAAAYNKAALLHFGEFAWLNLLPSF